MQDQHEHDEQRAAALRQELRDLKAAERAVLAAERAARPTGAGAVFIANVRALGGYHALDERGRAHFDAAEAMAVARRPYAKPLTEYETARRGEWQRIDGERKRVLAVRRSWAHDAGFRRLSRWIAAGAPSTPRWGRTPYRSGS